jgi:hypothetical protein
MNGADASLGVAQAAAVRVGELQKKKSEGDKKQQQQQQHSDDDDGSWGAITTSSSGSSASASAPGPCRCTPHRTCCFSLVPAPKI